MTPPRHLGSESDAARADRLRLELAAARADRNWWRAIAERRVTRGASATVHIALGLDAVALGALTAGLTPDDHPVVVTDCAEFRHARTAGVVLEYLPDERTWLAHRPDLSWDDLLTERFTRILIDHGHGPVLVTP